MSLSLSYNLNYAANSNARPLLALQQTQSVLRFCAASCQEHLHSGQELRTTTQEVPINARTQAASLYQLNDRSEGLRFPPVGPLTHEQQFAADPDSSEPEAQL
jgi:hypothetical protein